MRNSMPKLIYKYRDWQFDYYKESLADATIWFSHLNTLNYPYDIRIPYTINYEEVNHPNFLKKIKTYNGNFPSRV